MTTLKEIFIKLNNTLDKLSKENATNKNILEELRSISSWAKNTYEGEEAAKFRIVNSMAKQYHRSDINTERSMSVNPFQKHVRDRLKSNTE